MRIAFLVPAPIGTVSGGYNYDRRLIGGLRANGHAVRVVELAGRHPLPDDVAADAARAALDGLAPDEVPVVDGLGLPAFAPAIDALARRGGVGLIHHPTALERGADDGVRAELRRREQQIFPRLSRLVATSRLTADRLPPEFGVDAARVGVVEPGTDPASPAVGSQGPGCAILSVATLVPRKGHDVLLRALGRLTDLDWSLTVAGSPDRAPEHAAALRALATDLGIGGRVSWVGEVSPESLEALWSRADLFALASWWEGYGMAAAEAMSRGLPLALCSGGALAELMPSAAGVVAEPGNADSLSRAMRRVIFDGALRARMADASRRAGQALPRWNTRAEFFAAELGIAARAG